MFASISRIQFLGKSARSANFTSMHKVSAAVYFSMTSRGRYDFVVYGATGFTGQFVLEEVSRVAELERKKLKSEEPTLTFAIAGRNKQKLLKCIEDAKLETGLKLDGVGVIEADATSQDSIDAMTKQAKVVINCVGPYIKWGEAVVKSCIENGADHVDISGEPAFLEGMQLKYNKQAEEKGVHIVGACGYDSIPPESGIIYLNKLFPGGLNSVEQYSIARSTAGRIPPVNTGTLESALGVFCSKDQIVEIRRQLFPKRLPHHKYRVKNRGFAHFNDELGVYGVPFGSDEPVVYRTQRYRHDVQNLPTVQYQQYMATRTWTQAIGLTFGLAYLYLMAMFSFTRNLVLKYPSAMTGGKFSRGQISKEDLKKTSFTCTLLGKGWSEPLTEPTDQHSTPPDLSKTLKISGPDPGYNGTALMMVASATTLLREKQSCPQKGGVLTPGVAFANTDLIERLQERGMTFELKE